MRDPLVPYRGADVLNYLCIIAEEMLGESTLRNIPALASGFTAVLNCLSEAPLRALKNIRLSNCAPGTARELRLMVDSYRAYHQRINAIHDERHRPKEYVPQRYIVDEDLSFRKTWTDIVPDDVRRAILSLIGPLGLRNSNPPELQDPFRCCELRLEGAGYEGRIQPLGFAPPPPSAL